MTRKQKVSIVTPVYNAEEFLKETIESVLSQTFESFEYLLIDDCSTDKSPDIIKEYLKRDNRIKYVKLEKNSGAAVARNTGLENAKSRFIAFIDSDDMWYPEKLQKQLDFMKSNNLGFTYTKFEHIRENGEVISIPELPMKLNYSGLLKNTAIACSTVVIDREIIGDFRMPLVRKGQDTATWLQILKKYEYAYLVNEVLNQYRKREGSLSSNKVKALQRTWNTYRNIEKLPLYKAIYYFSFYVWNAIKRRM